MSTAKLLIGAKLVTAKSMLTILDDSPNMVLATVLWVTNISVGTQLSIPEGANIQVFLSTLFNDAFGIPWLGTFAAAIFITGKLGLNLMNTYHEVKDKSLDNDKKEEELVKLREANRRLKHEADIEEANARQAQAIAAGELNNLKEMTKRLTELERDENG